MSDNGSVFYLPTYLRVIFMEVEDINIREFTANFYCSLIITVYYKNLPEDLVEELSILELSARNVENVFLVGNGPGKNADIRNNIETSTMEYNFRGKLPLRLDCDVLLAPFEVVDFKLYLTFHSILVYKNRRVANIKFNFMDIEDLESKCVVLYRDSNVSGFYGLAESSIGVDFSAVRLTSSRDDRNFLEGQLDERTLRAHREVQTETFKSYGGLVHEGRVRNWKFATYGFKMYRYPLAALISVLVPMYILSFISLVIFWEDARNLGVRVQTMAALLIAYSALVPTIRAKIPPSPQITFLEYLVYALMFSIFLAILDTFLVNLEFKANGTNDFVWYRNWRFMLSFVNILATAAIALLVSVIYKCVWEPRYNFTTFKRYGVDADDYKVDTISWHNTSASDYLRGKTSIL